MGTTTRELAIEAHCRLVENPRPVEQVLADLLGEFPLDDPRDHSFLLALIHGVFRWQGYLDWVIGRFSSHPVNKMKPRTLSALRIGIFQLLFMDRVPAAAAINETVAALKRSRQPKWLTGFVNGVLRAVARATDIPPPSDSSLPPPARLNHPQWLIDRWATRHGMETAEIICAANNTLPGLCLRVSTSKISREALLERLRDSGVNGLEGSFSPAAIVVEEYRGKITDLAGYGEGLFQVQGEAAQLATPLLFPLQEGGRYLDGCAGLGGKTTHMAEKLPPGARLTAVEPDRGRLALLRENLNRLALGPVVDISNTSLEEHDAPPGCYTGILVDAPCSGLGVIRRHPEIRWHRSEADLQRYQAKQIALLDRAAHLLAPGGVLVYLTCSTEPEENEQVVEAFRKQHPEITQEDGAPYLPREVVDKNGFLRIMPGHGDMDGFFGARLRKEKK